jgi:phosphate-selective porin OprO and OprP
MKCHLFVALNAAFALSTGMAFADTEAKAEAPPAFQGFSIADEDSGSTLRVRGIVQGQARFFSGDDEETLPVNGRYVDNFSLRRVRPIVEGTAWRSFAFRIMPDFGASAARVEDAYVDLAAWSFLKLRLGKQKTPFSLERLQSDPESHLLEASLAGALAPVRDVGLVGFGEVARGAVQYQVGVFNGVANGVTGESDIDDNKDMAARLFVKPLKLTDLAMLHEIGFGVGMTDGIRHAGATSTGVVSGLSTYRSVGGRTILGYRSSATDPTVTAIASGRVRRYAPQVSAYVGPVGFFAEYIRVDERIVEGATVEKLTHQAWEVTGSVVLTGQKASYSGVKVEDTFDVERGYLGVVELVGRYDVLELDDDALTSFGDAARHFTDVTGTWVGLNWFPNNVVKVSANYVRTTFDVPDTAPEGLEEPRPEQLIVLQTQLQF